MVVVDRDRAFFPSSNEWFFGPVVAEINNIKTYNYIEHLYPENNLLKLQSSYGSFDSM